MVSTTTPQPPTHLFSRRDAAVYLAISPRKLDSLVADRELPSLKIGSRVLFDPPDLATFIASKKR